MLTSKPDRLLAGQLTCFLYRSQLHTIVYVLYTVQCTLVLLKCVCFSGLYMNPLASKDDILNPRTSSRRIINGNQWNGSIDDTKTEIAVKTLTKFAFDTKNLYKVKRSNISFQHKRLQLFEIVLFAKTTLVANIN